MKGQTDGSFSWTWCDSHLISLFFGELPPPANDREGFRLKPMPDSVAPIKTTGEHDKPPE